MNIKILFLVAIGFTSMFSVASAATDDFVADSDITVTGVTFGSGTADMLILNGSTTESWMFDAGVFTATNPGTFKVGSSDSSVKSVQVTKSGTALACAENSTPGTSYVTLPTASGTYTISPSTSSSCTDLCTALDNTDSYNSFPTCGAASCDAGYKLSGSGSSATCVPIDGTGTFNGVLPNIVEPRMQIIYPDGRVVYQDEIQNTPLKQMDTSLLPVVFKGPMVKGMTNNDIKKLQKLLASDPVIYPEALITGYFGELTERAVQRFQSKYDIVSSGTPSTTGYGYVGPKTRAKLQEVFSINNTPNDIDIKSPTPSIASSFRFDKPLFRGISSPAVKYLQQVLNSDPNTRVAQDGPGSVGNETEYLGYLTEKAIQKFQEKYNIASQGDPGYGYVGPKTRTKLNELL